jgi:hypothetical protein
MLLSAASQSIFPVSQGHRENSACLAAERSRAFTMWERISPFVGLAVVGVGIYLGYMLLPPYFNNWQFQDSIETEARLDTYNTKPEADIKRDVLKAARDNNVAITDDMVNVVRTQNGVSISAAYVVHVDLPGYPVDLKFNAASKNAFLTAR